MLMLDRYLVAGGRALDLATGASIRWHVSRHSLRTAPVLFTVRRRAWLSVAVISDWVKPKRGEWS